MHAAEEDDEAEMLPQFNLLREVSVDGSERRRAPLEFGHDAS